MALAWLGDFVVTVRSGEESILLSLSIRIQLS
jgi:hypothetical protein